MPPDRYTSSVISRMSKASSMYSSSRVRNRRDSGKNRMLTAMAASRHGQNGEQRQRGLEKQQDDPRDQAQGRQDGDADGIQEYQVLLQLVILDSDQV